MRSKVYIYIYIYYLGGNIYLHDFDFLKVNKTLTELEVGLVFESKYIIEQRMSFKYSNHVTFAEAASANTTLKRLTISNYVFINNI